MTRTRQTDGSRSWLLENLGIVITIAGIVLYAAVKFEYFLFYTRLGIEPEEVGLGYAQILSRSALALLYVAIPTAAVWLVALTGRDRDTLRVALVVTAVTVPLVIAVGAKVSLSAASAVKHGATVTPGLCNVLGLRAEVAAVTWLGTPPPDQRSEFISTYVGSADGQSVFYDAETQSKLLVPSAAVIVQTRGRAAPIKSHLLSRLLGC